MSNLGLEQALTELGLGFYRAKVGDRYVAELLDEKKLVLGGEQSGHIVNRNFSDTGDGIISALQVLSVMHSTGDSLHSLVSGMQKYPQILLNMELHKSVRLLDYPEIDKIVREVEMQLGKQGRVLLRLSGTEPLLRIMAEGSDAGKVRLLAHKLVEDINNIICE